MNFSKIVILLFFMFGMPGISAQKQVSEFIGVQAIESSESSGYSENLQKIDSILEKLSQERPSVTKSLGKEALIFTAACMSMIIPFLLFDDFTAGFRMSIDREKDHIRRYDSLLYFLAEYALFPLPFCYLAFWCLLELYNFNSKSRKMSGYLAQIYKIISNSKLTSLEQFEINKKLIDANQLFVKNGTPNLTRILRLVPFAISAVCLSCYSNNLGNNVLVGTRGRFSVSVGFCANLKSNCSEKDAGLIDEYLNRLANNYGQVPLIGSPGIVMDAYTRDMFNKFLNNHLKETLFGIIPIFIMILALTEGVEFAEKKMDHA